MRLRRRDKAGASSWAEERLRAGELIGYEQVGVLVYWPALLLVMARRKNSLENGGAAGHSVTRRLLLTRFLLTRGEAPGRGDGLLQGPRSRTKNGDFHSARLCPSGEERAACSRFP